uniref:Galectin n=1 Tax=Photinus pyralis TaxID=7054 RepID=A0A1Y1L375_PHOPY
MVQVINNPAVPFVGPIKGGLDPGSMIRIQGAVPENADKFNVNLHCGRPPSDVALHISVRLLQGYIARNSLQDDDWGEEEGDGNLTIGSGQSFEILILCDPSSYKIAVNGRHFCEFRHRIPFNGVSHLEIEGTVELQLIAIESALPAPPPPRQPPPNADFSSGYNMPPPPGNYGQGLPPQGPYGGGPGYYPHHPPGNKQEESGLDSIFGNAGAAIAGVVVSGLAENFLSGLSGGGGQSNNTQQHPPMQPQQPHYQGAPQSHGQQSSNIMGDILGSLASELAGGGAQSRHPQQPMHPQQPPYQGGPQPQGQQSSIVGDLLGNLASEIFKPSRRN